MTRTKIDGVVEEEHFGCRCGDIGHTICFTNWYGEGKDEKNIIGVNLLLTQWRTQISPFYWKDIFSFISHPKEFFDNDFEFHTKDFCKNFLNQSIYHRISIGLKYIFSNNVEQDVFDSTIFHPEHSQDFISMLDKIIPIKTKVDNEEILNIEKHIIDGEYDCYALSFNYSPYPCDNCEDIDDPEINTAIHFKSEKKIFKRLWHGVRYVFAYKSRYVDTNHYYIKTTDAIKLKFLLQKIIDHYDT